MCHLKVDVTILRPQKYFPLTILGTTLCLLRFLLQGIYLLVLPCSLRNVPFKRILCMENSAIIPADGSRFIVIDIGQRRLEGNTRAETECRASNDLSVTIRWGLFPRLQGYSTEQNPRRKNAIGK